MTTKVLTIQLEDQGQDFLNLDVDDKGILAGYSPIFSGGRLQLLGIGTATGSYYRDRAEVLKGNLEFQKNMYLYFKSTNQKDPLPWNADTFKYKITNLDWTNGDDSNE